MQRMQNRIILLLSVFLITSTISLAQNWSELGNSSNLDYASAAIATDISGNVYTSVMNDAGKYDVVKWNGTSWTGVGSLNVKGGVGVIAIDNASGNIYISGNFKNANDEYYVAKWDGSSWSELGTGTNALHANHFMSAIAIDANGNVYTAGHFSDASGGLYVAKWDGTTWSQLGVQNELNVTYLIPALAVDASGNVYAAANDGSGKTYLAKWDGTSWSELGGPNSFPNGMLFTILIDKSGYIYTAGQISNSNSYRYIAKWDGTTWSELGKLPSRTTSIYSLAKDNLGNLYAAGYGFENDNGNYVPKWDGSQWKELRTNGVPSFFATDQSGNIYATGTFTKLNDLYYIAKYDATSTPTAAIGKNNTQQQNELLFYPNPATSIVSCDIPEAGVLEVHSMQGDVLYTQVVSSGISTIDLSSLVTGMYCVLFKGQNNSYVPVKIVKQ